MKIVLKIIALLAAIMGIMASITGTRVLLGMFDPGYQYFTTLIGYNVIMGLVSVIAGFFIWKRDSKALFFALFITVAHIVVLILLKTVFNDIISEHSINAMMFRSVSWTIFSIIIWKINSLLENGK